MEDTYDYEGILEALVVSLCDLMTSLWSCKELKEALQMTLPYGLWIAQRLLLASVTDEVAWLKDPGEYISDDSEYEQQSLRGAVREFVSNCIERQGPEAIDLLLSTVSCFLTG